MHPKFTGIRTDGQTDAEQRVTRIQMPQSLFLALNHLPLLWHQAQKLHLLKEIIDHTGN